jgi:hypothetical protein
MRYWLLAGLLCVSSAQAEKLYQWVDEEGNIQFSDTPHAADTKAKKLTFDVPPPPTPESVAPPVEAPATAAPEADVRGEGITPEELKQRNCAAARQNYEILARNPKVMIQGEDGKMYPISEEEHQRRRDEAKQHVETFCGKAEDNGDGQ